MKKLVSIVTHTYNEQGNVRQFYERTLAVLQALDRYAFELIFIDNQSMDGTVAEIAKLCARDPRVKLIVNARNFGHIRSPYHAYMQARGAAVISLASDLEDPPELIPDFLAAWEEGYSVAAATYESAPNGWLLRACRGLYYRVLQTVSETESISGFTGFGLYDRRVVELMRQIGGPYPYVRGLISELGLPVKRIPFQKQPRSYGMSTNTLLTLMDMALLGLTSMSRAPIRFATLLGAGLSMFGFSVAALYLVAKLIFWNSFPLGQAPLLIGIFLFGSVQILIVGMVGEYIGSLHQRAQNHPHVVELYRINFDEPAEGLADPAVGPAKKAVAE